MIRNGFVSNSSSSSFIITGKRGNFIEGIDNIIEYIEKNPDSNILIILDKEMGDGINVFTPTTKIKKWLIRFKKPIIKEFGWRESIAIIDPLSMTEPDNYNYMTVDLDIPLKDVGIVEVDQDYRAFSAKTTLEDFLYYFNIWDYIDD